MEALKKGLKTVSVTGGSAIRRSDVFFQLISPVRLAYSQ